jgi:hypothetical protein
MITLVLIITHTNKYEYESTIEYSRVLNSW